MSTRIGNPRKKRRVYVNREPPFPVPIATISGETANDKTWFYYTGELHGNHVAVKHSGDIDFLYKMGFFGKGSLSKSKPDFTSRSKSVDIQNVSGETTTVKLTKRRSYIRHMKWRKLEKQYAGSEISANDLVEYDSSVEVETLDEKMSTKITVLDSQDDKEIDQHPSPHRTLPAGPTVAATWEDTDEDFWASPAENRKKNFQTTEMGDWAETDEDFWGCASSSEGKPIDNENTVKVGSDIRSSPFKKEGVDVDVVMMKTESRLHDNNKPVESESRLCDNNKSVENESRLCDGGNNVRLESESISTKPGINEFNENHSDPLPLDRRKQIDENNFRNGTRESNDQSNMNNQGFDGQVFTSSHDDQETSEILETNRPLDRLCEEEEDEGDELVIEDSDSETEGRYRKISGRKWLPVLKKDAYPMKEFLHLSLEEAFFLSFGLGCLIVTDNEKTLDLQSLWTRFCETQQDFLPNYVVYHYFRSLGWVPKSGLKFGTDFILYKVGPPFYHGSYSVVVKMIDEEEMHVVPEVAGVKGRDFSWISLAGLNRITEHVAKELMLCYVIKPKGLTMEEMKSPRCLSKFKVQQIAVNRWIPSQERQEKVVEEMP
ncbi:LOW QUALITY PROTEIN: tRNA-splicing endonuclease subunit Sen2-like [Pecten maximus]|uniref:LOW QUALITY PROTEIN: tRNA-splicing endonuclease subunit Sen2-like n=1 Tax=Pecten maximus TaxID=6579 RepID=UPI001458F9ED|nr:LOW QUALITY PROTEIN: tRNA-splicing endonuclease subunit Sen2-like [Pecten maximus]